MRTRSVSFFAVVVTAIAVCGACASPQYRADEVAGRSSITPLRGDLVATTSASYSGSDVPFAKKRFGPGTLYLFEDHLGFRPEAARDYQTPSAFPCKAIVDVKAGSSIGRPSLELTLDDGERAVFTFALVDSDRDRWVSLLNERCRAGSSSDEVASR